MSSVEALWTVEFELAGAWANGGVVVLETGRVYGGDSQYYYHGTFTLSGAVISADVGVTHYHGPALTAFGDNATRFNVRLQGTLQGGAIAGEVSRVSFPKLQFRMTRREELP